METLKNSKLKKKKNNDKFKFFAASLVISAGIMGCEPYLEDVKEEINFEEVQKETEDIKEEKIEEKETNKNEYKGVFNSLNLFGMIGEMKISPDPIMKYTIVNGELGALMVLENEHEKHTIAIQEGKSYTINTSQGEITLEGHKVTEDEVIILCSEEIQMYRRTCIKDNFEDVSADYVMENNVQYIKTIYAEIEGKECIEDGEETIVKIEYEFEKPLKYRIWNESPNREKMLFEGEEYIIENVKNENIPEITLYRELAYSENLIEEDLKFDNNLIVFKEKNSSPVVEIIDNNGNVIEKSLRKGINQVKLNGEIYNIRLYSFSEDKIELGIDKKEDNKRIMQSMTLKTLEDEWYKQIKYSFLTNEEGINKIIFEDLSYHSQYSPSD